MPLAYVIDGSTPNTREFLQIVTEARRENAGFNKKENFFQYTIIYIYIKTIRLFDLRQLRELRKMQRFLKFQNIWMRSPKGLKENCEFKENYEY